MKRFILLLFAAAAATGFTACNDTDGDYPRVFSFVTEHLVGGSTSDYYFEHDDGQTFYPGDKSRVAGYKGEEGRRAIIYYNFLKNAEPGYDNNVALYGISYPRKGSSQIVTEQEQLEKLGDAPVDLLTDRTTTRKWLNIGVGYQCYEYVKHSFALIRNDLADPAAQDEEDGFLNLELRHTNDGDTGGMQKQEYVSFDLDVFAADLEGKKGILLRVQTTFDGVRYFRIELPAEK